MCQEVGALLEMGWRGEERRDSTNACGAEGVVYSIRRDGVGGGGLDILNRFGGECLDFHFFGWFSYVWKRVEAKIYVEVKTAVMKSLARQSHINRKRTRVWILSDSFMVIIIPFSLEYL